MLKKIFLIVISFICFPAISQKHELGKVTIQELEEKACPIDTNAVAAILFSVGEVDFEYQDGKGFHFERKVRTKIKIYKKEGFKWANMIINSYTGSGIKEKLNIDEAITYNLVKGKIEKTKLKSDGELDQKLNVNQTFKKVTMPNINEGSIIELEYTLKSDQVSSIDAWYFQSTIPVLYSEFNVSIPQYFNYNRTFRGFLSPKIIKNSKIKTTAFSYVDQTSGGTNTGFPQTVNSKMVFTENKTRYVLENVLPLKEELYVNNIKNYFSSVEHELTSINYPNPNIKNYFANWEEKPNWQTVSSKIYKNENFDAELDKSDYYEIELNSIILENANQEEKLIAIFSYVQSKMNWNGMYGYSLNNGVKKAFEEKTGNVAEINLMLTSMLRFAGFDANPILISTISNGISLYPSKNAFDYLISGVELNNQLILLDATSKNSLPNILPIRDLNWFGRLIRKDESILQVNLMPEFNSKQISNLIAEIQSNGEIIGKVRNQYLDYKAFVYREKSNVLSEKNRIENIEKSYPKTKISELEVLAETDLSKSIVENYSFTSKNNVEIINDKMYFSPLLHFTLKENPFKQETRLYPIDFVFPHQDKYSISIEIPEGYAVETLPESKAIGMSDNKVVYKYTISHSGNQIQLLYTFEVNSAVIEPELYQEVKAFYKDMFEKQSEKIVLKKI